MAALSGITGITIELTINGTPYPAINADETTTTAVLPKIKAGDKISGKATINLMDGEPRVAFLDETEAALHGVLKFKVPYTYTANNLAGQPVASGTYFARDGINLAAQTVDPIAGWQCAEDGSVHYGSYVTGVRGDITLNAVSASGAPVLNASASPEILYARATSSDTTTITIRNVTGSLTITPSPASVLANDPPVQDNLDPSKYTVNIYFLGGSNPAWFTDSAPASVSITDNGNGVTTSVPLTLKNKYSYQLQTVGTEWTDDPTLISTYDFTTTAVEIEQGESLTFAAAAATLTGHYPTDREIVSFYYNDMVTAYYNKSPTPATITFSSASFTSRNVLLKALPNLRISRNINNGGYAGTTPQDGSSSRPYLLNYYGTATERKIQIEINDYACYSGNLTLVPDPSQHTNIDTIMSTMFTRTQDNNKFTYELKSGLAENSVYISPIKLIATDPTTGATKDVYIRVMKIQPYTVTFDTGTGNSTVAAQSVNPGAKATKPANPTNANSNLGFCGWYTSTDGGATLSATQYDFDNTTVTADITLYAKWGYTNFTGTAAQFTAAEFGTTSSGSNKYSITITDASDANIDQILAHFKNDLSNLHFDLILQGTLTEIPANAFKYGSTVYMYSISMPASVKKIGNRAFYNCSKLNIASLPSGLEEIGDEAFNAWSNYSVSFNGTSLKKIGKKALFDMGGTTISTTLYVTVPASVEELYTNSFITAGSKSFSVTINGTNSWTKMDGNSVVATNVVLTSNDVTSNSGTIYRYVRQP